MSEVLQVEFQQAGIDSYGVLACFQCGRCTGLCPLARVDAGYSPRRILARATTSPTSAGIRSGQLWSCLTCGLCQQYCPMQVAYPDFIQKTRAEAVRRQIPPPCAHGGALQNLMKLMTRPQLRQNRLGWVSEDLQVAETGPYLYFTGCLPYFDAFFAYLGLHQLEIASSSVRLLNAAGITPVVLEQERCCGHDLLWQGETEAFRKLAQINLEAIRQAGARTVVTSCAECARTLKLDYSKLLGKVPFQVKHLAEVLDEKVSEGQLSFQGLERTVTFQDPCRLGRHLGVYEPPRRLLESVPGLELVEMPQNRSQAVCCGTSCWTGCGRHSRGIQRGRMSSAAGTGAQVLVTACPKCAVHLRCSMFEEGYLEDGPLEIQDMAVLLSRAVATNPAAGADSARPTSGGDGRQHSSTKEKEKPKQKREGVAAGSGRPTHKR